MARIVWFGLLLSFLIPALVQEASAGLAFNGYVRQNQYVWNDSGYVLDTSYQWTAIGDAQLDKSSITINPCGSYLDVTEDAWVLGSLWSGTDPAQIGNVFTFEGTIQLPVKSAMVGAMVWVGDRAYQSHLSPTLTAAQYPYGDSGTVAKQGLDSLMKITQTADGSYQLSIYKVKFGESRHVRIRYLVANSGGGTAAYLLPVLFAAADESLDPAYLALKSYSDHGSNALVLSLPSGAVPLIDSSTYNIAFASSLSLASTSKNIATMRLTTFDDGAWLGNYLMLNATVADSVVGLLSKKIETVFLWRWNGPSYFVDNYYQDWDNTWEHYLSQYGTDAINQAQAIASMIDVLSSRGHRAGLVHSVEGDSLKTFPLSAPGSKDLLSLQAYLERIDEDYILSKYSWSQKGTSPDPRTDSIKIVQKTALAIAEFTKSAKASVALYSDSAGVLHHLVVLTAGPNTASQMLPFTTVDSLLANVTYDATSAKWRGVDFGTASKSIQRQKLVPYFGEYFPAIEPAIVSLKFGNNGKSFSYLFNPQQKNTFAIIGKSSLPWDTTLTWTGTDNTGTVTGTITSKPSLTRAPLDSGLVKLWAADKDRLAETVENNLGGTYGFVTRAYGLTASGADTVSGHGDGVAYLKGDEIYVPSGVAGSRNHAAIAANCFAYHTIRGALVLMFGSALKPAMLRLFDLNGRLLAAVNLTGKLHEGSIAIPLAGLSNRGGAQTIVATIEGANIHQRFTFVAR